MSAKLKHIRRQLLIGELQALLDEIKRIRKEIRETEDSTRSDYLGKRVEVARVKLDDLKRLQRREKEIKDRRRRIDQDNAKRDGL